MKVIDMHRHYWGKGWDPPRRVQMMANIFPGTPIEELIKTKYESDPDGSQMIAEMDILGIDTVVLHTVDTGLLFQQESPTPIEEINRFHCELAKRYPGRVYALFGIDPRRPGGVKMFEKALKEWGASGLSFYPPCGFYINERICYPYYQKCIDYDVPVTCHTGYQHEVPGLAKYSDPICWDDVGNDLPDLMGIICHTGLDLVPSDSAWERAMCVAQTKLNLYVDVADWQREYTCRVLENMPELFRKLRIMRDRLGAHRILFGTDMPTYDLSWYEDDIRTTQEWVKIFSNLPEEGKKYGATFTQEESELITHGNAERILGMKKI